MKVAHRSETLLTLDDRPWLNGFTLYGIGVSCIVGFAVLADGKLTMHEGLFGLLPGSWPILIGLALLQQDRLIFDRETQLLTRERRSIRGRTTKVYGLDRVVEARVEKTPDGLDMLFQMELRLSDPAEIIPFTNHRVSGRQPKVLAQAVNEWLATQGAGEG